MRDPTQKANLNFPPWFPPFIEVDARYFHTKATALGLAWKVAMIERLVSDSHMKRVWQELSERRRDGTAPFEHRATPPVFAPPMEATVIQQKALRELFVATVQTAEAFKLLKKSERAAVTEIADFMRERFGSPKYTLTATLSSVALERDITASKVREWTRAPRNSTPGENPEI
jgi:hypothetical protein